MYMETLPTGDVLSRAKELRIKLDEAEAARLEHERTEAEKLDRMKKLSDDRAEEFIRILVDHDIRPSDIALDLNRDKKIGCEKTEGWQIRKHVPETADYSAEEALFLLTDLRVFHGRPVLYDQSVNVEGELTRVDVYAHGKPLLRPFAEEEGLDILGNALIEIGIV
jgi:hypothetical protein